MTKPHRHTRGSRRLLGFASLMIAVLAISSCSREEPVTTRKFLAFGTIVEVSIYGVDRQRAETAIENVQNQFEYMHKTWHPWQPGPLARVNNLLGTTDWFSVPPSIRPLIIDATPLANESDNLFNPAVGKLIKLWGFNQDERPPGPPPAADEIAALVAKHPRMSDLELDGIRLRSRNPAVVLDFGGFAKGYGIDRVVEYLQEIGIHNAIVNAGGDLRAIGRHGDRPWHIGIRNPRPQSTQSLVTSEGESVLAALDVEGDESVFTSGDYERYFEYNGKRYGHILDPRTGYPAKNTTSVTVIDSRAATADAAATALFVAGPKDWYKIAKAMGIHYVMLVDKSGTIYMNPAMAKRIHIETEKPPKIVLSDPL
jgi:thiamine biosynthesis lipoprotein